MASFKICVRNRRKDGLWPVYLRLTHNRKVGYIKTGLLVNAAGLARDGEVRDAYVVKRCMNKIEDFAEKLNRKGVSEWSVAEVKKFLTGHFSEYTFSDFADSYIERMNLKGSFNNAKIYLASVKSLAKYLDVERIGFEHITRDTINNWIVTLSNTKRAKTLYPTCMRILYREAVIASQEPDSAISPITYNPWSRVAIPTSEPPRKRAISADSCRRFFSYEIPAGIKGARKAQLRRDVAMLSFCLAAINTVDLYKLRKSDLKDGVLRYCRSKTSSRRRDGAYIEMRVTPQAAALIDKYKAEDDDELLLSFRRSYSSAQSFVAYIDSGIVRLCEIMQLRKEDYMTFYTFRHTWATIARNDCGASLSEVGFAMNHIQSDGVTRGYIKPDFRPAWELNERVVSLIFPDERPRKSLDPEQHNSDFELSSAALIRVAVFHAGKCLCHYEDIGFSCVDEVLSDLPNHLEDGVSVDDVTVKIVNCDSGKVYAYERQKGKGF